MGAAESANSAQSAYQVNSIGFRPLFSHSRLDASGPMAGPALGDQRERLLAILLGRKSARDPLRPQLHRVPQAQAARVHAGIAGGLRHEQSDPVVRTPADGPTLLLVHLWRLAAQYIHARRSFEVAQVEV